MNKSENNEEFQSNIVTKLASKFYDIQNIHIYKGVLWILGEFTPKGLVESTLSAIIRSIGTLPIEDKKEVKKVEESKVENK